MNTTERIVEAYFRHCRGCLTATDVKVKGGNNRQLDILAVNLVTGDQYHAEVSVKIRGFDPTKATLEQAFKQKFFGEPRQNEKATGDWALGKDYRPAINKAYREWGISPTRVQRIWVCWDVRDAEGDALKKFLLRVSRAHRIGKNPIQIWSFRERILPELEEAIGTSNYSDDALRTFSLLAAAERQRKRGRTRHRD